MTKEGFDFIVSMLATALAERLSEEKDMTILDAFYTVYNSKLFTDLSVENTKYWQEHVNALYNILDEEMEEVA
jgi:hypothetical protein